MLIFNHTIMDRPYKQTPSEASHASEPMAAYGRAASRPIFNKAQIELLDTMASIESDEELMALKHAISEFFARRADEEMDLYGNQANGTSRPWKTFAVPTTVHPISNESSGRNRYQLFGTDDFGA